MMHRGWTIGAAMFASAAICLQPRVAVADTEGDVAAILSLLSEINTALTQPEQPTGIEPLLYDEWVYIWSHMDADHGVDPSTRAGRRWLERSKGLSRLLWEEIKASQALTNGLFGVGSRFLLPQDDAYVFSFYNWASPDSYGTDSLTEFLSLTLGQTFDMEVLDELEDADPTNAWEAAFSLTRPLTPDGYPVSTTWTAWEAEAWRRQLRYMTNMVDVLRVNVSNSAAWNDTNTRDETNVWEDVLVSSTNEVGQGIGPEDPFTMPTNAVTWFGPSDGDGANVSALLPSLDWELEGEELEARLFGFDELGKDLTGTLSIDFSVQPWSTVRSILQFAIAVTTCCVLVGIVRSEVNFWTTLGGSAT